MLRQRRFADVPPNLAQDINRHYAAPRGVPVNDKQRKQDEEARRLLAAINAARAPGGQ